MDFAKNILSKYGWQEGDGLGKEKQGIKRPIKANLKFDQVGLGSNPSEELNNNWWERVFNDAAKNVNVKKQKDGEITLNLKDEQNSVEVTTKSYSVKQLAEKGSMYGNRFLSEGTKVNDFTVTENKALTDEELFRACGGRTAHKGARHGLKLSGKLARIEQQEKDLLAQMQLRVSTNDQKDTEKGKRDNTASEGTHETNTLKKSKKRKSKGLSLETISSELTENCNGEQTEEVQPSKRTKKELDLPKKEKSKKKKSNNRKGEDVNELK